MEPRISFITPGVFNLARSIKFYRDGLGLPLRPVEESIAFFETKGTCLALFPREAPAADAGVAAPGTGSPKFTPAHKVLTRE